MARSKCVTASACRPGAPRCVRGQARRRGQRPAASPALHTLARSPRGHRGRTALLPSAPAPIAARVTGSGPLNATAASVGRTGLQHHPVQRTASPHWSAPAPGPEDMRGVPFPLLPRLKSDSQPAGGRGVSWAPLRFRECSSSAVRASGGNVSSAISGSAGSSGSRWA